MRLAESLYNTAKADWKEVKFFEKLREKKTTNHSRLFSNRYDVMRQLIHALVLFDKLKPGDHHCVIAYLCIKHPEYEFDWETLEIMRLLRNGIQYKGQPVPKETWISYKLKFEVYITSLFKFVKEKIEEHK